MDNVEESLSLLINEQRSRCVENKEKLLHAEGQYQASQRMLEDLETALRVYQERSAPAEAQP